MTRNKRTALHRHKRGGKARMRVAAATIVAAVTPLALGAGAAHASTPIQPITVAGRVRVVFLPPSPCRPSESGGTRCIDIGSVAQIYLVPPSPCAGGVACL